MCVCACACVREQEYEEEEEEEAAATATGTRTGGKGRSFKILPTTSHDDLLAAQDEWVRLPLFTTGSSLDTLYYLLPALYYLLLTTHNSLRSSHYGDLPAAQDAWVGLHLGSGCCYRSWSRGEGSIGVDGERNMVVLTRFDYVCCLLANIVL